MAFKSRTIMGIAIACSLILSNCAFPVRPGYDRKSGSYKRYRVPKQAPAEIDTTTINPQEELVLEEKLAAGSSITDTASTLDAKDTSAQNSTVQAGQSQPNVLASLDSTGNKEQNSTSEQTQKQNAKATDSTAIKNSAKKAEKKDSSTKKKTTARPTNLEKYAREWLGAKYVYGAASKKKTDCSGYVMQVYKGFYGISLDHSSQHMFDDGRGYSIRRSKLQEGDLVFFGNFWKISHVGIYLKGNRFIHASTSSGVIITPMDDKYWASKYKGARRFK
ncbi:MAG: C40 family peptidase [Fibrobacter sp.]|nr:C40 family peptidase [Fibrobacter sp.]